MKVISAIVALCVLLEAQAAPAGPALHGAPYCSQEKIGILYPDCTDFSLYYMCTGLNEHLHVPCRDGHLFSFEEQRCVEQHVWSKAAICRAAPGAHVAPESRPELDWPHHQQQPGQPWPQPHPEQGWPQQPHPEWPQQHPQPNPEWPQQQPHPEWPQHQPQPHPEWPQHQPHPEQGWPQHPEMELSPWPEHPHMQEPAGDYHAQHLPEIPCAEHPIQDCPCPPEPTQCPPCWQDEGAQLPGEPPCNPPQSPDWTQPPLNPPVFPPIEHPHEPPHMQPIPPIEIWPQPEPPIADIGPPDFKEPPVTDHPSNNPCFCP